MNNYVDMHAIRFLEIRIVFHKHCGSSPVSYTYPYIYKPWIQFGKDQSMICNMLKEATFYTENILHLYNEYTSSVT